MAHSCDWLPTLAELCGVKLLNDDVDGRSLVKVLKSETAESPHDVLHWTIGGSWAVRQGPWKLLGNPRDTGTTASWSGPDSPGKLPAPPKLMLVNIEEDPSETTDRSSQEPEVFKKLKAAQDDWAARLR
jgi:arylsulfatase A-like enzyme